MWLVVPDRSVGQPEMAESWGIAVMVCGDG
jgi:hypothetical protein